MENKKKKIAVYLTNKEYDTLLQSVINSNKTLTSYCKEKIFSFVQVSANEDFLRNQIIHHSQTRITLFDHHKNCLSTIRFYIILKPWRTTMFNRSCLSTIRFYIILKHTNQIQRPLRSLSTIRFYIILKLVE